MSDKLTVEGFESIATNPEVLQAFMRSGLTSEVLGRTLEVSEATIKKWQKGETRPRRKTEIAIDDIRAAMASLMMKGFAPEEAATIMQGSRSVPPHEPFIEFIVREPDLALEQIASLSPR